MRILDIDGNEIQEQDVDLELGHLDPDRLFIEHHDAIPAQERIWHYAVETVYFEDGTTYKPESEDDPRIDVIDAKNGNFDYIPAEGEEPREIRNFQAKEVEDQPAIEGKEAWDEYEDIQRYILYTEEEIAEREAQRQREQEEAEKEAAKQQFLEEGPGRLDIAEDNIEETSVTVEDLVLIMADLIGGEEVE